MTNREYVCHHPPRSAPTVLSFLVRNVLILDVYWGDNFRGADGVAVHLQAKLAVSMRVGSHAVLDQPPKDLIVVSRFTPMGR